MISLFKKVMRYLYMQPMPPLGWLLSRLIVSRIKKVEYKIRKNFIDFAFDFSMNPPLPTGASSMSPHQIRNEIKQFLMVLSHLQPEYVMEIGTANGGTLFLFAQVAKSDAKIISVDLPRGYPEWKIPLYRSFARASQRIYLLREDSHDPRTLNQVKSILGDQKLDFLFIDGDHSYEGVKKDFKMYSPLVRKGGIIAFHDIIPDYFARYGIRTGTFTGGVPRFWQEIKHNCKHQEIVQDYNQDGYGIGVIYW